MPPTDAALFLPLSDNTLHGLLDESMSWEQGVLSCSMPELASLWLLAGLTSLKPDGRRSPERLLADIIDAFHPQLEGSELELLRKQTSDRLNRDTIEAGYYLIREFRIALLDDDSCEQQDYLTEQGRWDYGFSQRQRDQQASRRVMTSVADRRLSLSTEQSRVFREFQADNDEHMHVQGYAGTGKTSLIKSLLSLFETSTSRILVLAEYSRQLDALGIDRRHSEKVHACTFSELADLVIPPDLTSSANRNMLRQDRTRATQPDDVLIRRLGIRTVGNRSSEQIITAVRATVFRFCQSTDERIEQKHIPARYAALFDSTLHAIVCQHARELWQAILAPPTADFRPQVRGFHKIKWAALNRWPVPAQYSHVLVDECHDLPRPVFQILACSPQARATLGDDYQNLNGRSTPQSRSTRLREMVQSVRSGHAVESIINPIITVHPSRTKAPFQGNDMTQLDIRYYRKAAVPQQAAVILVNDTWGLFEWSQRLASANINPSLLNDHKDLDMFVQDCIELKAGGRGARHGELFRYSSWLHVASEHAANTGFQRINQLLDKGYGHAHWKQTYQRFQRIGKPAYSVGLIENVRNLEFDTVMLTPDVVSASANLSRAAFSSAIYVAVTRARKQLILPESLRQWIEEISARSA
ncbi:AAA family ATPase [Granulosicoccus sp. 3-233]|uniref:AAA family ATPase n=1 Tax=Granulosicoccus sp. 3-233 TaxID=3417969 RepID=UPI003D34233F